MKKIFFGLMAVVLISSCKSNGYFWEDPGPYEENLAEGKVVDYTKHSLYEVTSSDSLASIARKYGTTSQTLIALNNLKKPYSLKSGMLIKVPTVRTSKLSSEVRTTDTDEESASHPKIIQIEPSRK